QEDQLRELLIQGTRVALLIALPIELTLFFRGQTFIGLWMGQEYAVVSSRILRILLLAFAFGVANYTSSNIIFGLSKHKPVALMVSIEAVANFALSVFLVQRIGIEGVAWGTLIPRLAIMFLFWPRYICPILNIPVRQYIWRTWIQSAVAVAPFGAACYLADFFWSPKGLLQFMTETVVLLPVLCLGVSVCFRREITKQFRLRSTRRPKLESADATRLVQDHDTYCVMSSSSSQSS